MAEKVENTRELIVRTSEELFAQYGIRSVSIDDICKQLGISKKTFYVYFEQKADLVDALLEEHDAEMANKSLHWLENHQIVDTLSNVVAQMRRIGKSHETPPMLYDLQKYYPACYEKHKKRFKETHYNMLVRYLQRGKQEGVFRANLEVELCAEFLTRITMDMIADRQAKKLSPHRVQQLQFIGDLIMRGIVSPQCAAIIEETNNDKS